MKSAPFTADSGSAAKLRRDWLAPGFNPTLTSAGQALATVARSFASASGPGSQATTSSPWARQRAAQPPPIRPAPTRATRRISFFLAIAKCPFPPGSEIDKGTPPAALRSVSMNSPSSTGDRRQQQDQGQMTKQKKPLRSTGWFGGEDKGNFVHRSWMKNQGFPPDLFDGRPVIGICNTWSELTPCNAHLREIADRVKRGVWEAGGLPLEFPVMSMGETNLRPTAMLYRNLVSMDVEESLRANPIDGVVLLCGCDKTTPALVMGAASCDLPTLVVSGGPMLNGKYRGQDIGSGTAVWRFSAELKTGRMTEQEFFEAESCMSRSAGHCMTMGTASTMAAMVEALGLGLPHNAAIPAVDSRRGVLAQATGRRIVEMVREDLPISRILTREAFENAIRVNGALGGSTNAVIHLLAIAGRIGIPLKLEDWDGLGRK